MIVKTVKVISKHGIHMRPCNMIVDITMDAQCDVFLSKMAMSGQMAKASWL